MSLYYVKQGVYALASSLKNDPWKVLGQLEAGSFVIILDKTDVCGRDAHQRIALTKFGLCHVSFKKLVEFR